MDNHRFGHCRRWATIIPPAWSACSGFAESSMGAKDRSCSKVRKPSRTERSRPRGLWCPDPGPMNFLDCVAKAASMAILEKDRMDGWTIGSNDQSGLITARLISVGPLLDRIRRDAGTAV